MQKCEIDSILSASATDRSYFFIHSYKIPSLAVLKKTISGPEKVLKKSGNSKSWICGSPVINKRSSGYKEQQWESKLVSSVANFFYFLLVSSFWYHYNSGLPWYWKTWKK